MQFSTPGRGGNFSRHHGVQTFSEAQPMGIGAPSTGVRRPELYLHLPKRLHGVMFKARNTSSWRNFKLSNRNKFTIIILSCQYLYIIYFTPVTF
jgi:hypothetical protein